MTQNAQQLYQQALVLHQQNQLPAALQAYQQVVALQPTHADAHHRLGLVYYLLSQLPQAAESIAKAVAITPKNTDFLNNYGLILSALNQHDAALKSFQQAILLQPKDLDIQLNLGNTLLRLNRFEEAAGYYRRLIRVKSALNATLFSQVNGALCHCLSSLGNEAHAHGRYLQAEACFQEAISFDAKNAVYYYNLANAQRELGKAKEAALHYQKSLTLNPNDADTHNNLGNVQRELGQLDLAIASYQQALKLNPNLYHALVHLVHQKQHICDWDGLESDISTIRDWVANVPEAQVSPFAFLAMPNTTAAEQLMCTNHWVAQKYAGLFAKQFGVKQDTAEEKASVTRKSKQKIKVAYLSADFRLHPLAFLITELIEKHDRSQFEILGFSFGVNDKSPELKRLEKAFDTFYDIQMLSEFDAATKIQSLHVDILVDLTGFTQSSRSGIVALKPAKVHINWLGFPGSMGGFTAGKNNSTALFDYLITDSCITPPNEAPHYAEKLLPLPTSYQANNHERPLAKLPSKQDCGLPNDALVFCCFNQTFKITPAVFNSWMQILKDVPNSVLWLLECNRWAKANLNQAAANAGIESNRLIFAPRMPIAAHIARHTHADLFLDTQPYNAHTSASDALWMGVPLLTCTGDTFAARVATSLLKNTGLSNADLNFLIADNLGDYTAKARWLAENPAKLSNLKQQLLALRTSSALFNTAQFTQGLENNYQLVLQANQTD